MQIIIPFDILVLPLLVETYTNEHNFGQKGNNPANLQN